MFALLPLRHLIVDAEDEKKDILSVDFDRRSFLNLNFESLDASDTISEFPHRMRFTLECKFQPLSTTCTGKQLHFHGDSAPLSRA